MLRQGSQKSRGERKLSRLAVDYEQGRGFEAERGSNARELDGWTSLLGEVLRNMFPLKMRYDPEAVGTQLER
jgi:hypothetical protein